MHSGDIERFDGDGYLHLDDRQKDVIKSGGEWISSIALENLISQYSQVRDVTVIGANDDKWGERPLALVAPRQASTLTDEDIKVHLRRFSSEETISPYAVPEKYRFVEALAKTSHSVRSPACAASW